MLGGVKCSYKGDIGNLEYKVKKWYFEGYLQKMDWDWEELGRTNTE